MTTRPLLVLAQFLDQGADLTLKSTGLTLAARTETRI